MLKFDLIWKKIYHSIIILKKILKADKFNSTIFVFVSKWKVLKYCIDLLYNNISITNNNSSVYVSQMTKPFKMIKF